MSLMLKVAENQLEPLVVSITIQRLRVSTTLQKQCPCHQRPVLLARVTFVASRCSTAVLIKYKFYLSAGRRQNYIPESLFLQPEVSFNILLSTVSLILSTVSLIATRDYHCYPDSLAFPLEVSTVIQILCICHKRSILVTIGHESASRGQYCYTETLSLLYRDSVSATRGQYWYPESMNLQLPASISI